MADLAGDKSFAGGMTDETSQDSSSQMSSEDLAKGLDSELCYCGLERRLGSLELQCGMCLRWYHADCIKCEFRPCVPFMTNYQFFCKVCSTSGESFTKKQASFSQMCHTAIANLMSQFAPRNMFSKDKEIIPYIEENWDSITTLPRRVKQTWHTTIAKTLLKENEIFTCSEEAEPLFGLCYADLPKIGPNFETLKTLSLSSKTESVKPTSSLNDSKGRGTKRKAAESQTQQGQKQKKSETGNSTRLDMYGYPLEHPFNKDGYRYILAEPDPHAPNRQAFDESLDWAGKPIPGYLYRTFIHPQVVQSLNDRAGQLKVSDDRLTITGEKGYSMIRATHGVSRGKWYFEVSIDEMPAETAARIGWSQSLGNLQAPCGYDKFSYSYRSRKGTRFHESHGYHYGESYQEGDVVGFYIDLPCPSEPSMLLPSSYKDKPLVKFKSQLYYEEKDYVTETEKELTPQKRSKVIFFKNGVNQGEAFTDIYSGYYYPAISLYKNATVTANYGPSFKFQPKDLDFQPMSEAASLTSVENTLRDILYHTENEGQLPDF